MKKMAVPVIMYHSIGIPNKKWQWNHLTCPYKLFESQLKWLKKKKFHTITLQQLYDYMKNGTTLPKNPIILTFDDGYLDNWIYAYPLLKKYGFKGTIFVNSDFVDPTKEYRPNLDDVWTSKTKKIKQLKNTGFLSWGEMRKMEEEGVMNVQSHTLTHTWYFKSDKIIDFRHPGDSYIWMTWNNNLIKKPYLQIDDEELVNYGEPVYQYGGSIEIRRYLSDENLKGYMISYVKEKGGKDFFNSENWRGELFEVARKYKEENQINGRFETEKEYEKRVCYELQKSKEIIEDKMNKDVKFLCWPCGFVTDKALKMASNIEYISSTTGKDIKHKRKHLRNKFGELPSRINRIGSTLYWNGIEGFENKIKYKNGFYFVLSLYNFQDRKVVAPLSRIFLAGISRLYKTKFLICDMIRYGDKNG